MQQEEPTRSLVSKTENAVSIFILLIMTILPLIDVVVQLFGHPNITGSNDLVQNFTLWIAVVGAMLASRSDRLLALSTPAFLPDKFKNPAKIITSALAAGITAGILLAGLDYVRIQYGVGEAVAFGIPKWVILSAIPVSMAVLTVRFISHASDSLMGKLFAASGLLVPLAFWLFTSADTSGILLPFGLVIIVATALGMPIFTAIGGATLLMLWLDGTPLNDLTSEAYSLASNDMMPALPLFALAGFILAEGGSGRRLTRLFSALTGWLPGGTAIAITLVLALFTPLTAASGLTILSMGALFLPVLVKAGYPFKTSMGLITVAGSIGLLIPPSLPVFLYAIKAEVHYGDLFIGGIIPGALLFLAVAGWAAVRGHLSGVKRTAFQFAEARAAVWESKWEILLPVVLMASFLFGFSGLVETAALMILLSFVIECVIYRDLDIRKKLPSVFVECATLVGGFMIILCMALGFTNCLILGFVPDMALEWVQAHIENPLLFLLALNILLIIVGALMDIYSALIVVVPLITPMAAAYGIDPVHLGIIFLANMELGYLMPPMGENLFLSSYRFDRPLTEVYRSTLPYVLALFITVMAITYLPFMTLGVLDWLK
jgi:C4-dicarboxylate transporter DctM subunit